MTGETESLDCPVAFVAMLTATIPAAAALTIISGLAGWGLYLVVLLVTVFYTTIAGAIALHLVSPNPKTSRIVAAGLAVGVAGPVVVGALAIEDGIDPWYFLIVAGYGATGIAGAMFARLSLRIIEGGGWIGKASLGFFLLAVFSAATALL